MWEELGGNGREIRTKSTRKLEEYDRMCVEWYRNMPGGFRIFGDSFCDGDCNFCLQVLRCAYAEPYQSGCKRDQT